MGFLPEGGSKKGEVGFSIEEYAALRPTLWHLTHVDNLRSIRESRVLRTAEDLTSSVAGLPRQGRELPAGTAVLRDQKLLHEKCIIFEEGFSMAEFLRELNKRVFFWSGRQEGPVRAGKRALDHYRASDFLIRLPFLDVAKNQTPYFSRCNSGAPRMQHGKPVARGRRTFLPAIECDFQPREVIEVTFIEPVRLSQRTEIAQFLAGPWEHL